MTDDVREPIDYWKSWNEALATVFPTPRKPRALDFNAFKGTHYLSDEHLQTVALLKVTASAQASTPLTDTEIQVIVDKPSTGKLVKTHGRQRKSSQGQAETKCNGESCKGKYYKPATWELSIT